MRKMLLVVLALSFQAQAENFDLKTVGSEICKVDDAGAQLACYTPVEGRSLLRSGYMNIVMPGRIEIVDEIVAAQAPQPEGMNGRAFVDYLMSISSSFSLSEPNKARVVEEFSRISVRNIAIDEKHAILSSNRLYIPFVASVYWIDKMGLQGTINVEGLIESDDRGEVSGADVNTQLTEMFNVESFSDSSTEQGMAFMRGLETASRRIHFREVNGARTDEQVDVQTVRLLEEVVGPAVMSKLYMTTVFAILEPALVRTWFGTIGLPHNFRGNMLD